MRFRAYEETGASGRAIVLADTEHDSLAIIAPDVGFNMIRCRLGGHETIEGPPDRQTLALRSSEFGVPLLWPPGRIARGAFAFRGKPYAYPVHEGIHHLHGEIRMRPWNVVSLEADQEGSASATAEFRFERTEASPAYYPHSVALRMTWRLCGKRVFGTIEAANEGEEEVPFGFGLHPYFAFRGAAEEVAFKADAALQYFADADGVCRRMPVRTGLCEEMGEELTLDRLPKDVDHFVFRMKEDARHCEIFRKEDNLRIRFDYDRGFPYLIVFKPAWMNALSLEPWSCISDANNSPLPPKWTGAAGLQAGERRRMEWSWQAESMEGEARSEQEASKEQTRSKQGARLPSAEGSRYAR
ncbi:aldose 1-epimerase [Paenibacillus sp. MSJ-34]|uniref:aldose 1-epimerase n=1 Tax=Paenibacillus sp. MSJ-34 TaxID=2841529 RepID=UPI001C108D14|nr:aldose 1-epimerase [Paenibacillus sp. MSJ-34]MBU5442562.1 aldose 1-epimerase [Paenibacillus sp. MSJ-34]